MRCPYCNSPDSRVTDSRTSDNGVRRRRECTRCGLRFTTYERVQTTALLVAKADGRREEFNRQKLMDGIVKACAKRRVPYREIEKLVEDIEAEMQRLGHAEIRAAVLGDMVMERLRRLDRVAYIRFASVYRDFQDIDSFEEVVKDLKEDTTQLSLMEGVPIPRGRQRRGRRPGRATGDPGRLNNGSSGHGSSGHGSSGG
ncbi:MAG: transcriptional regulator NrdR [Dehalococcoidia bacterium]|nr:transcriptional regulator NrdR [Dehalococcoidia bacterium]